MYKMPTFREDRADLDAHLKCVRTKLVDGRAALGIVQPNTFLGRKTQEPFPSEDDEPIWVSEPSPRI
jgi:hypothetical protein